TQSTNTLYTDSRTFFDWQFNNASGGGPVSTPFVIELWVDNERLVRYPYSSFGNGQTGGFYDWSETVIEPGWHTVKLIADPDNVVSETNENNNTWQSQFYWQPISGWTGEYFNNIDLSGNPWLTRDEATIDFDWLSEPPDPSLPSDGFSARWTR